LEAFFVKTPKSCKKKCKEGLKAAYADQSMICLENTLYKAVILAEDDFKAGKLTQGKCAEGELSVANECLRRGFIENILKEGQQKMQENGLPENPVVALVESAGGLQQLEALQEDPNEDVYHKAVRLLETYFPLEDDDDRVDVEPIGGAQPPQGGFFGAQVPQGGFNFGA